MTLKASRTRDIMLLTKSGFVRIQNMKNGKITDQNVIHPIQGYEKEIYVKPTINNPNIIVGSLPTLPIRILKAM